MGLDLWFREDVMRILAATHETMRATLESGTAGGVRRAGDYEQGFTDALRVVGLAFGLASLGKGRWDEFPEQMDDKAALLLESPGGTGDKRPVGDEAWGRKRRD